MTIAADLFIALFVIVVVSAVLFAVAIRLRRSAIPLAILAVILLILYALWLGDNPRLTHLLPLQNALLWGNLQLPAAALLAGVAWRRLPGPLWQRITCVVALAAIGFWRETEPLIGHPPKIGPSAWTHGICRQSSLSSCSAAAAATLLRTHDISTSEAEMIDACLTHMEGTTTLGLYRGLKLKTAGTPWTVYADSPPKESIDHWILPAVVTITIAGGNHGQPVLSAGVGHSVVVFGTGEDGKLDVGDPLAGRQRWTRQAMMDAYGGDVISLIDRNHK